MKKKTILAAMVLACSLGLAACSSAESTDTTTTDSTTTDSSSNTSSSSSSTDTSSDDSEEVKDDEIEIDADIVNSSTIDLSSYSKPVEIASAGTYTLTGSTTNMVIVDAKKQDVTLILDGVDIDSADGPAIYIRKAASVTIQLKGDNTITSKSTTSYETLNACLYSKADLIIEGDGSLNVNSGYEHGIKAKDTYTQNGGSLAITAPSDGIHINEDAIFNDGTISITSGDEGIQSEMGLTFKKGTYTVNAVGDALRAETDFTVDGGTFDLTTDNEGMESKDAMVINGGTITILAKDDGINAINSLIINDGTVTAISSGNDGIDSNGDLIINGGTITASGTKSPEQAFDVDNTPFEIHGGDIVGIGSSVCYPTSLDQPVILVGSLTGTVSSVEVKDGSTTILSASFDGTQSAGSMGGFGGSSSANLTLSSSKMKIGGTYSIYVNGSLVQEVTLSSQTTTIGSVSTMGGGMGGMQPGGMNGGMTGGFGHGGRG